MTLASESPQAVEAGIRLLQIPTPFQVGRVNCYLIEDDPLTLVDTGPNSGKALDELESQIGALGRRLEDIELIVLTHQHIDHTGLASILARRSGAEVAGIGPLAEFLGDYRTAASLDDEHAKGLMLRHGIDADVVEALSAVSNSFRAWGAGCEVTRRLDDGGTIDLAGRRLEVQHRPGHSPTDTCFWDAERRMLLAADHLIGHISSNPLLSRPLDGTDDRPRSLLRYLESLALTRELEAEVLLPGHGEPVTDHAELIDKRIEMHRRRAEKLYGLIAERPRTAHALAQALWGNVAVTQAFLTLSEVLGHTDMLIAEGRVREVVRGEIAEFEAVP